MLTSTDQILAFVKQEYQGLGGTSNDIYVLSLISKNYYQRSQLFPYKERIVQNAAFTTSSTNQTYALSSDFDRLVPDSVRYGVTSGTGSSVPPDGYYLPEVPFEQREFYRGAYTNSDPQWCTVVGSTASNGRALYLFPQFTNSGSVVTYDYYTRASSLGSSATLPIQSLGYVVAYDTLKDWAIHEKNQQRRDEYAAMAKESWRSVFTSILPDT